MEKLNIDELPALYQKTTSELSQLLSSFSQEEMITIPFEGSWSAAQLAEHIAKSNRSICGVIKAKGQVTMRQPDQRVVEIRDLFLDRSNKFNSPQSVLPTQETYDKETLVQDVIRSLEQARASGDTANLLETAYVAGFGELTKLELLYFVLFHTQRHINQLGNIRTKIKN